MQQEDFCNTHFPSSQGVLWITLSLPNPLGCRNFARAINMQSSHLQTHQNLESSVVAGPLKAQAVPAVKQLCRFWGCFTKRNALSNLFAALEKINRTFVGFGDVHKICDQKQLGEPVSSKKQLCLHCPKENCRNTDSSSSTSLLSPASLLPRQEQSQTTSTR